MGFKDVDRVLWLNREHKAGFSLAESAVLTVIAHHTKDSTHKTIVGQQRIADEIGCEVKTVQRAVGVLTASGVIARRPRVNNGYKTTDEITFNHEWQGTKSHPTKSRPIQSRKTPRPTSTDSQSSEQGLKVPAEENTQEITQVNTQTPQEKRDALFEVVWKHWPRADKKKPARDKFARLKAAELQDVARAIVTHGDAYRQYSYGQYTPHLISWLNQQRWTENPPQPRQMKSNGAPAPMDKMRAVMALVTDPQEIEQ